MRFLNFCQHQFGEVKKGYQYCTKCGKANLVGCNHKWEIIDKVQRVEALIEFKGYIYTLQCKLCGSVEKVDNSHYHNYEKYSLPKSYF